jgi:hypothetical protein
VRYDLRYVGGGTVEVIRITLLWVVITRELILVPARTWTAGHGVDVVAAKHILAALEVRSARTRVGYVHVLVARQIAFATRL